MILSLWQEAQCGPPRILAFVFAIRHTGTPLKATFFMGLGKKNPGWGFMLFTRQNSNQRGQKKNS